MENSDIRILVADDESDIRKILRLLLQKKGYHIEEASDGEKAVDAVRKGCFDLVLMDIMMPRMNGIQATAAIREFSTVPVLFLTARSLDNDKYNAYTSGGDDYLVKPFSSRELLLKVDALLRRYTVYSGKESPVSKTNIVLLPCGVEADPTSRVVSKNGSSVSLRERESDIFFLLLSNRGETIDSNRIFEEVWGERVLPSSSNNVMVNMLNLRKKLEDDPQKPKIIKTVWGKGYKLE